MLPKQLTQVVVEILLEKIKAFRFFCFVQPPNEYRIGLLKLFFRLGPRTPFCTKLLPKLLNSTSSVNHLLRTRIKGVRF